jgi:hypothetical protein
VGVDDDPTEYLAEDLKNSPIVLKRFHEENPTVLGLLKNLGYWLEYVKKDVFVKPKNNDNTEVKKV